MKRFYHVYAITQFPKRVNSALEMIDTIANWGIDLRQWMDHGKCKNKRDKNKISLSFKLGLFFLGGGVPFFSRHILLFPSLVLFSITFLLHMQQAAREGRLLMLQFKFITFKRVLN